MAIVLSQTDKPSTDMRDFEEELVAILLMKDGLEVSIIGDIANIEPDSTDALCLEGVRGNLFLVSWYDQPEAKPLLEAAGVIGTYDGQPATSTLPIASPGHYDPLQRQILCLSLSQFLKPIDARRFILKTLSENQTTNVEQTQIKQTSESDRPVAPAAKPMPKRQTTNSANDALDTLLDDFDEIDL